MVYLFCNPRFLQRMWNGCRAKRLHSFYAFPADRSHPPHAQPDRLTITSHGTRAACDDAKPVFNPVLLFSTPAKPKAGVYEPTHPAIVRLIKRTVDAARQHKVWVSVCGEMAGDPTLVPLLIGLGVDELSAAPPLLAQIKYLIRRLKLSDTQELAAFALESESATEILARSAALAQRAAPSLFDMKK